MKSTEVRTTDEWPWSKIIKHVLLSKPKGSPKAGRKEIVARLVIGTVCVAVAFAVHYLL